MADEDRAQVYFPFPDVEQFVILRIANLIRLENAWNISELELIRSHRVASLDNSSKSVRILFIGTFLVCCFPNLIHNPQGLTLIHLCPPTIKIECRKFKQCKIVIIVSSLFR